MVNHCCFESRAAMGGRPTSGCRGGYHRVGCPIRGVGDSSRPATKRSHYFESRAASRRARVGLQGTAPRNRLCDQSG